MTAEDFINAELYFVRDVVALVHPWLLKYWMPLCLSVQHLILTKAYEIFQIYRSFQMAVFSFFER
jgi:hypothetical protein